MITLGNSAFKPYYREGTLVDPAADAPQKSVSESPENPMDLIAQLSLLANLKSQLDAQSLTLPGLGDLQETMQNAASNILQQFGLSSQLPPIPTTLASIEQLLGGQPPVPVTLAPPVPSTSQPPPPQPAAPLAAPLSAATPVSASADEGTKNKRKRTTFTNAQQVKLEMEYNQDQYMPRSRRLAVADSLRLTESQVKTWFQNRRAKDKKTSRVNESAAAAGVQHSRSSDIPSPPRLKPSPPTSANLPMPIVLPPSSVPTSSTSTSLPSSSISASLPPLPPPPTLQPISIPAITSPEAIFASTVSTPTSLSHTPLPLPPLPSFPVSRQNDFLPQIPDLTAFPYNHLNGLHPINLGQIQVGLCDFGSLTAGTPKTNEPNFPSDLYRAFGYQDTRTTPLQNFGFGSLEPLLLPGGLEPLKPPQLLSTQLSYSSTPSATAVTPPMHQGN
ncbi:unnamed protein product, partial [Mesorhabditis spiculigera]